jgi:esterase/lipase superfamily enzyme
LAFGCITLATVHMRPSAISDPLATDMFSKSRSVSCPVAWHYSIRCAFAGSASNAQMWESGREQAPVGGWCRYLGPVRCRRNRGNSILIADLDTLMTREQWRVALTQAIGTSSDSNDVLLFVHGFNNDFTDAVVRAAQIAYGVGFVGTVAAFDWTSRKAGIAGYVADDAAARASTIWFEDFIGELATQQSLGRLIIVAFSMGTLVASNVIRDMESKWPRLLLGQVVYAASDIDSTEFVTQLASKVRDRAERLTLYASSNDYAIRASKALRLQRPRVGSGPPSYIILEDIDYVDASGVDTDLIGHAYVAENEKLLQDLYYVMTLRLPARRRYLLSFPYPPSEYYKFR